MPELRLDPMHFEALEEGAQALLAVWNVGPGERVHAGQEIGLAELVKASVPIEAPVAGRVQALCIAAGESFGRDAVLAILMPDPVR